ncbi:MAG: TetR/AcrR family transcriptional regulator [Haliea sp.]|nr:MAG: TetR/AcrR family transcriptional regulator [Haliea sp.]
MGRTRQFDHDTVLAAAANLFRQRGFKSVAIADLEAATGLASGSIYNTFGDKLGLFKAALQYYVSTFVGDRLKSFAGEQAGLKDLEQLFLSVLAPPMSDGYGCLVNNSIIEFGGSSDMAAEEIAATLAMVRVGIDDVLRRQLGPAYRASDTTRLLVLYHGVLTLSRSQMPVDEMAAMVRSEFTRLSGLRDRPAA